MRNWSIAASNDRGEIVIYRSDLAGPTGQTDGDHNIDGLMFDHVEDSEALLTAWARAHTTGREVSIRAIGKRTQRYFLCTMIPLPRDAEATMVTFCLWGPERTELLTDREVFVCSSLLEGMTTEEVAARGKISKQQVTKHRRSAMEKLGCTTREQFGLAIAQYCDELVRSAPEGIGKSTKEVFDEDD